MTTAAVADAGLLEHVYIAAEQAYLRSLPPEHFMEAYDHSTQRQITIESFAVIKALRKDVHFFNEILVQYPRGSDVRRPGQVVPDNFVVLHTGPITVDGSFNTPLQPVGPFLVMEYVSKHNQRKDYIDNLRHYEDHLKVPYYLLFHPGKQELRLGKHDGGRYDWRPPNHAGRFEIPELDLEAGLVDGWIRFWFRGELVLLPDQLLARLKSMQDQLDAEKQARLIADAERDRERAARLDAEAEVQKLREMLAKKK